MGSESEGDGRSWFGATPLARAVSPVTARRIERNCKRHIYDKGQEIISRTDEVKDVFLLTEGIARVIVYTASGKAVNFRRLEAGALFGEFSAIDGERRAAVVEAAEPCRAISISAGLFVELLESDPDFMKWVLCHLVGILRSLTGRIIEFSTLGVVSRIHMELLRMAYHAPGEGCVREIAPAPTHLEIAGRISTHREAVSREISRLKQSGVLEQRGRSLIIRDVGLLERMVRQATGEQPE